MKVSQRLFLGVVPSIVGLLTVGGLAYWGQYAHTAPSLVVVAAALASVISLLVAWTNTRYVALRVERLAGMRASSSETDELDAIEHAVESLDEAAAAAKADAVRVTADAEKKANEYARLIAEAATSISTPLAEARLSLHVLQENHFGELNDNQEEMISAARMGVESAELELQHLRTIADLDRGKIVMGVQLVKAADIIRSLLPLLKSRADKKNVRVLSEIEPGLPRVSGDRAKLHDAFNLLFNDAVTYAVPGTSVSIHASAEKSSVVTVINHGAPHSSTGDLLLAQRLIAAQGGSVRVHGGATVVMLPQAADGARP